MGTNDRGTTEITGHFQLVYPTEYIKAPDLRGKDVTVTIARVTWENLVMEGGRRDRKAVIHMTNSRGGALGKRWVVGKTVLKQIGATMGTPFMDQWKGRQVTMYPTTCKGKAGETMECIRVRVRVSQAATEIPEDMAQAPAPRDFLDEAEGSDGDNGAHTATQEPAQPTRPAPAAAPPTEARALAARATAAKYEAEIAAVASDFDAAKARLSPKERAQLETLIAARRESLAGIVDPGAEPDPVQP